MAPSTPCTIAIIAAQQHRPDHLAGFGGMLTFLTVGTGASGRMTRGPFSHLSRLSPNPSNGAVRRCITDLHRE